MTLLHLDGFDEGIWASEYGVISGTGLATATGRLGGLCLGRAVGVNGAQQISKSITASATVYAGIAFRVLGTLATTQTFLLKMGDGDAVGHVGVEVTATGALRLVRAPLGSPVVLGTAVDPIVVGAWYYLELRATIHDTTGRGVVKLNGATVIDFTGDTRNAGTATNIDAVRPFNLAANNTQGVHVDDFYVANALGSVNNDFLGDVRVVTLSPDGNGNSSQLVGSDGNSTDNYALVDEIPMASADYVGSATVGQKDTYTFTDVGVTGAVKGLSVVALAANGDAGGGSIKLLTRRGGTDYASAAKALGTSYLPVVDLQELDPSTSAAWTTANVNAAEFGVEVA